ncbi:MAG TPA: hypothetical protein VFA65_24225 [Bryobacteraceae bacterium]|nr:hypothetical protein [Bryobacteraceae bacterium]
MRKPSGGPCKLAKGSASLLQICVMRQLWTVVDPEVFGFSAEVDVRHPLIVMLDYALIATFVVWSAPHISSILLGPRFAQITPTIIRPLTVYVVDIFWPSTDHQYKCDAMCKGVHTVDA